LCGINLIGIGRRVRRRRAGRRGGGGGRSLRDTTEEDIREILALEDGSEELGVVALNLDVGSLKDGSDVLGSDGGLSIVEDEGSESAAKIGTLVVRNSEGHLENRKIGGDVRKLRKPIKLCESVDRFPIAVR
jgi:hypothetical protein